MRRILITIIMAIAVATGMEAKGKKITILHTNDTHSQVEPIAEGAKNGGMAGYARRMAIVAQEREEQQLPTLLVDAGDFVQGTPYFNLYHGRIEVDAMNRLGYDAATLGNHEFDNGIENLARLVKKAKFAIVCANYDFTGTILENLIKPYTIIKRNGIKIGVFGLSPQLDGLVMNSTNSGVKFIDPAKAANETARLLKEEEKCDMVVCLSHLGWDILGVDDTETIPQTRNIDIVLGGHSHSYFTEMQYIKDLDGKDVPNDQNGKHGIFVGKIVVSLAKE